MSTQRIAIVQGAPSGAVDDLFAALVERWSTQLRIAGALMQGHGLPDRKCSAGYLRAIPGGKLFSLFDEAGDNAVTCHLDGRGAVAAAEAVAEDIAKGCDLVVLNKFAKLEEAGEGLSRAFAAAIQARIPLLTSVSPARTPAFEAFAGSGATILAPDAAAIDGWIEALRARAQARN